MAVTIIESLFEDLRHGRGRGVNFTVVDADFLSLGAEGGLHLGKTFLAVARQTSFQRRENRVDERRELCARRLAWEYAERPALLLQEPGKTERRYDQQAQHPEPGLGISVRAGPRQVIQAHSLAKRGTAATSSAPGGFRTGRRSAAARTRWFRGTRRRDRWVVIVEDHGEGLV